MKSTIFDITELVATVSTVVIGLVVLVLFTTEESDSKTTVLCMWYGLLASSVLYLVAVIGRNIHKGRHGWHYFKRK